MTKQIHLPLSNAKDLTFIKIQRQNRNVNDSEQRIVIGVDTETHDGNIFLLADSDGNRLDGGPAGKETKLLVVFAGGVLGGPLAKFDKKQGVRFGVVGRRFAESALFRRTLQGVRSVIAELQ